MDHRLESRMEQGRKLRSLYRYLGYSRSQLATFLQVTERTIYHWEAGDQRIPFAVIKLLRVLSHQELPGASWQGWSFSRGTLWSPEGHGFEAKDFAWLSQTLRRSAMFDVLYRERTQLRNSLEDARRDLAHAETRAATAEGRAGLVELALTGALAGMAEPHRERVGLGSVETRPRQGDVLVTRHQLLDFEHFASPAQLAGGAYGR